MRMAARPDENQEEIVEGLRKAGVSVMVTSNVGDGFPDLVCATKRKTALIEIKNPASYYGKKGLNTLQAAFARAWRGELYIAYTLEDALKAMGVMPLAEGELPPVDWGWGDFLAREEKGTA